MNILYISLTRRETGLGWMLVFPYLILSLVLSWLGWDSFLLSLAACGLILWLFRRFWEETRNCLPLTGKQLFWKPLFGCLGAKLVCTVMNDILLLYGVKYFVGTEWGPFLWDIRSASIANSGILTAAVAMVFLMPIVEEFLFRGVIMGSLYPKFGFLAILLSTLLFALFHAAQFIPYIDDRTYLFIYFLQYIPAGLILAGIYISTDSIAAPILMHMLYNAFLVKTAFDYM